MARPGCETPKHPLRCHAGASLVQVGVDAGAIVPEGEAEHVGCRDVIHSLGAVPPGKTATTEIIDARVLQSPAASEFLHDPATGQRSTTVRRGRE